MRKEADGAAVKAAAEAEEAAAETSTSTGRVRGSTGGRRRGSRTEMPGSSDAGIAGVSRRGTTARSPPCVVGAHGAGEVEGSERGSNLRLQVNRGV